MSIIYGLPAVFKLNAMNETDKAIYLMETFGNDKIAIGKVIQEILSTCSYSETLYYKKVRNIINNQKN